MVSSQMHWSLVIERTEESIRFSLELNWINLRQLRSAAGFLQGPLCPYGKKMDKQYMYMFSILFFLSYYNFLMEVAPFGFLYSYKDGLVHMHCGSNGIFFFSLSFQIQIQFRLAYPVCAAEKHTHDMLLLSQALLQEWDQLVFVRHIADKHKTARTVQFLTCKTREYRNPCLLLNVLS